MKSSGQSASRITVFFITNHIFLHLFAGNGFLKVFHRRNFEIGINGLTLSVLAINQRGIPLWWYPVYSYGMDIARAPLHTNLRCEIGVVWNKWTLDIKMTFKKHFTREDFPLVDFRSSADEIFIKVLDYILHYERKNESPF